MLLALTTGPAKPTTLSGGVGGANGRSRSPGEPASENTQTMSPLAEVVSATDWQTARLAVVGVGYPGGTLPAVPAAPLAPQVRPVVPA